MTANSNIKPTPEAAPRTLSGGVKTMTARAIAVPAAAFITGGLFLAMQAMISTDFQAQEKRSTAAFVINPEVIDIVPQRQRDKPELLIVEVPPAPPVIDKDGSDLPDVEPVTIVGTFTETVFKMNHSFPKDINIDQEPRPILRFPPAMPSRFATGNNSGFCDMRFDVNPQGHPFNISAALCTNKMLRNAAIKSVQKWKYNPRIVSGTAVAQKGFKTRIRFDLKDQSGSLLPLPRGFN